MSKLICQRTVVPAAHKSVIYQLFLRAFTPEGTLNAASELLPHLAELGIDIVYLCPICVHDPDENPDFWSDRQKASGCNNPKNPYRISDYYHVEPEYGTDDDLKRFIRRAHGLGMKVMLDLVYFHCGPTAALIDEHPDFVMRNDDGSIINGQWHFPKLNFDNPALREYLFDNMVYYVNDFDVDGYRTDVGDGIPLDFWEEARRRLDKINPDLIMLNEGFSATSMVNAFDVLYGFHWASTLRNMLLSGKPVSTLSTTWLEDHERLPEGALMTRHYDNHDLASDDYGHRFERVLDRQRHYHEHDNGRRAAALQRRRDRRRPPPQPVRQPRAQSGLHHRLGAGADRARPGSSGARHRADRAAPRRGAAHRGRHGARAHRRAGKGLRLPPLLRL